MNEPIGIIAELKRRNVFRVGMAYVVLGWVMIEVTDTVAPALGMPAWTLTLVTWFGIIGFPFAVLFAWAFELTPEGIKREHEVDRSQSVSHNTGRKLDFAIIGLLVVALGLVVWDSYLSGSRQSVLIPDTPADAIETSRIEGAHAASASIAVLPLTNMSAIADNVFFAGGVHEEVLTNLARIKNLRVVSRTTAMSYVNSDLSVRDIGRELGVRYVVEGSVRRINNHVRVTVQLIDAEQDKHLWASNYDRELIDVFATQSAVAGEISNSLHLAIQPETVGKLDDMPTRSVRAYDLYMKARSIDRSEPESESALTRQAELLEAAVREDPEFVEAWGFLSEVYDDSLRNITQEGWFLPKGTDTELVSNAFFEKSLHALKKAYSLDPENLETLIARASNTVGENHLVVASVVDHDAQRREVMDLALEKYPGSARAWYVLGWWYSENNRPDDATAAFHKAIELDPLHVGIVGGSLIYFRLLAGDQAMTTLLTERLAQIVPQLGENEKYWGKASIVSRLVHLLDALAKTADEALIEEFVREINKDDVTFSDEHQHRLFQGFAQQLQSDMNGLLGESSDLQLGDNPDFVKLADYLDYQVLLLGVQRIAGQTDAIGMTARRIIGTEQYPVLHHHFNAARNHAALAVAYSALGETEAARHWIDKLINERDQSYNAYGIAGYLALAQVDLDRVVALTLEEKSRNPTWSGIDVFAVDHWTYRQIIIHPDMQAFYVNEGKWIDYLAARVPEYAKHQER